MTVTILIFSEIIHKRLGSHYSFRLANTIAMAIQVMLFLSYPIVLLMGQTSKLIGGEPQQCTREDVRLAAKLGVTDGIMVEREAEVISRCLARIETKVESSFTPTQQTAGRSRVG